MATTIQVSCIRKRDRQSWHERIQGIGGVYANQRWFLSEEDAIRDILAGKYAFFVSVGGRSVDVIVAVYEGRYYLKTVADDYIPNNLLSLPECP